MKRVLLLAEDDDDLRMTLASALRNHGYHVLEACDEEEGRTLIERGLRVDMLVTDVEMPGARDGLELAAFFRVNYANVPIVVMSGGVLADLELPDETIFLAKPFGIGGLLRSVEAAMDRRS